MLFFCLLRKPHAGIFYVGQPQAYRRQQKKTAQLVWVLPDEAWGHFGASDAKTMRLKLTDEGQ
jgi:hypothetical protein